MCRWLLLLLLLLASVIGAAVMVAILDALVGVPLQNADNSNAAVADDGVGSKKCSIGFGVG
jgi:hypothetical protein